MMKNAIFGVVALFYIFYFAGTLLFQGRMMRRSWKKYQKESMISTPKNGIIYQKKPKVL